MPSFGHCTSSAFLNACPLDENRVSETCLTLELIAVTTGERRAGWLVGVYSVSGAGRLLRLGFGLGFRFGFRVGLGFDLRFGLLFGRFLEVRGVPAGALQLEARRAEQLLEGRFAAGRALA